MAIACDRTGTFRAEITAYGLRNADSGAVAVSLAVLLTEIWNGEAWQDWREFQMEAHGDLWVIKKDGTIAKNAVNSLIDYAGWDGSLDSVANDQWRPTPCQVQVGSQEYKGETQYRIEFVNDFNRNPAGGVGNVSPEKAKELSAKYGSQLRALVGNRIRNTPPEASSKPSAPPPVPRPVQPPMPSPAAQAVAAGEIPF